MMGSATSGAGVFFPPWQGDFTLWNWRDWVIFTEILVMKTPAFLIRIGLLMLVTVISLVFSLKYYGRHRSLRIFTYYVFFSLLTDIAGIWERSAGGIGYATRICLNICCNLFVVFEFLVISVFILYHVKRPPGRLAIKTIVFLGILLTILFVHFGDAPRLVYVVGESILLVCPCLIYFYGLFNTVSSRQFNNEPAFWVVTGVFFLKSCCIPLWLTLNSLGTFADMAFTLNIVLYSTLFLLLIKAYCCHPDKRVAI
jgi:hypothetical protein